MDLQLHEEEEKHQWAKKQLIDSQIVRQMQTQMRLDEIEAERKEILYNTAEYDHIASQNVTLHTWLKNIVNQFEQDSKQRGDEKEEAMQKNFDIRMSMDQVLRKTIRNFDSDYNQRAVKKMDDEAHIAKVDMRLIICR